MSSVLSRVDEAGGHWISSDEATTNTLINITSYKTEKSKSSSELIQQRHDVLHQALVRDKPPSLTYRQRNDADPLRRTRLLGVFLRDCCHTRSFHAPHFPCFRGHPSHG